MPLTFPSPAAPPSPTYTIILAGPQHLTAVADIETRAGLRFQGAAYADITDDTVPLNEFISALLGGRWWIVLADDEPVGFALVKMLTPDHPHLEEIDVLPEHGQHGLGTSLLRAVQTWLAQSGHCEITTILDGRGLAGLVNNAGVATVAPIEFQPVETFRQVFEVNVFGLIAVTQTFLPLLHRSRGRIVNIGSIGGLITIPFGASLCGSKHTVEAISDCLRLELYPAGIHVTCLQPASINSGSAEKLADQNEKTIASLPPEGQRRYADLLRHFMQVTLASETKGSPPTVVAQAVLETLKAENPPSRRVLGKDSILLKLAAQALPDALRDRLFRKVFFNNPTFGSTPAAPE